MREKGLLHAFLFGEAFLNSFSLLQLTQEESLPAFKETRQREKGRWKGTVREALWCLQTHFDMVWLVSIMENKCKNRNSTRVGVVLFIFSYKENLLIFEKLY
jgi:hypothetical protein